MSIRILLAPSADLARVTLAAEDVVITVEAEYGAYVAEGRVYTAAHHQPVGSRYAGRHLPDLAKTGRPSPCNDPCLPALSTGVVLVSHVDLDTFGGCFRAIGWQVELYGLEDNIFRPEHVPFWDLAEWVDVRGAHKLGHSGASVEDIARLHAFWAWSKAHSPRLPRDRVSDVTALVGNAKKALSLILADDVDLLAAGEELRASEQALNERTFSRREGAVLVRVADEARDFCNHLYTDPSNGTAAAVASLTRETGAVTISLADPVAGVSCRALVQGLWGAEAGGHDGIAGSPRERKMSEGDLEDAVVALVEALQAG